MPARIRFVLLCLSQTARLMAECALYGFAFRGLVSHRPLAATTGNTLWYLLLLFAPGIVLAPIFGPLADRLSRRKLLGVTAGVGAVSVSIFALAVGNWLACAVVALALSALSSITCYAMLPAAARDARIPLIQANTWLELSKSAVVIVAPAFWIAVMLAMPMMIDFATPVALVALPYGLSVVAALGASFPSDSISNTAHHAGSSGFLRALNRIIRDREARTFLIAWSGFRGLIAGAIVALIASSYHFPLWTSEVTVDSLFLIGLGGIGGSFLAGLQVHPRRNLALIPIGLTGLVLVLIEAAWQGPSVGLPASLVGIAVGLVNVPLAAAYESALPEDIRGSGMAIFNAVSNFAMLLFTGLSIGVLSVISVAMRVEALWLMVVILALSALASWYLLSREFVELLTEFILWPAYYIRGKGPGLEQCPARGPLLIVANHASYLDPIWIGKVVPRRLIPMMTSLFYDLPIIRWLMVYIVKAIRVPSGSFRREAPELDEAIRALDAGEVLVIFPEAMLRRTQDQLLRGFGQGVWHILRERPKTPVITCWIEGGWGSYFSYYGGPPGQNKPFDWRRPIDIALAAPATIDPHILEDQRRTRRYLRQACLETRKLLRLEPPENHVSDDLSDPSDPSEPEAEREPASKNDGG
jgi:1-acyl-sn-glycerol-3-phosphate acyltransferase